MNAHQLLQGTARKLGLLAALCSTGLAATPAQTSPMGQESNLWPLSVLRSSPDGTVRQQAAGPLLFSTRSANGDTATGLRPFWLDRTWADSGLRERDFLYPLFIHRSSGDRWTWSVLGLINRHSPKGPAIGTESDHFDIWPFYFSRQNPDPALSYRAVFPLFGPLKHRLFNDRVDWVLFPLYGRFQKAERVTVTAPWPFFRYTRGGGHSGHAVWPLYGVRREAGVYNNQYALWPLLYRNESGLDDPAGSTVKSGFLPFYSHEKGPGHHALTVIWPFFGTTHDTQPARYDETRLLWPLFVQGRGDTLYRNRWAPFYTHSKIAGVSKTWILWPLWRDQSFQEKGLDQRKRQFLFWLWWDLEQRRPGASPSAPVASKTHLWPLYSAWNNGAGRRQLQVLSPFEVLFQHNDSVRQNWSPLLALYRSETRETGYARRSALWDFVSWERSREHTASRLTIGPLLSTENSASSGRRLALFCGLVGFQRSAGSRWTPFFFDFRRRPVCATATAPLCPTPPATTQP